ncbi:caspase family protein [Vagococcus fluvialis]
MNEPNYEKNIAIIIAIEEYTDRDNATINGVKYAKNDAYLFEKMLIEDMNVKKEDIYLIINEQALKNNLRYELKSLFASRTEKDRLIF